MSIQPGATKAGSSVGASSGSTPSMNSPHTSTTCSPLATSMPLHFIQSPVYAQVSHSLGALSGRGARLKKVVEKVSGDEKNYGALSRCLLQQSADPLRVRFRRVISGEVAVGIALADLLAGRGPALLL